MIIPLGLEPQFLSAVERPAPPPRAIFLSNPLRSLDWLMTVWVDHIYPQIPNAEFHLFCGAATYGAVGDRKAAEMAPILTRAQKLSANGVVLHDPLPKEKLINQINQSRVFLYRGDKGETFCLAAAEAQALGLPGVTEDIGCMSERIRDRQTGFIVRGEQPFADAAIQLLKNDTLWQTQHRYSLATQNKFTWNEAAKAFEELSVQS